MLKSESKQTAEDMRQKCTFGSSPKLQYGFRNENVSNCVLQLTMIVGDNEFVGTATIININNENGKLHSLTCAHNVLNGNSVSASKIWFQLDVETFSATKFHVWPEYITDPQLGHDLAMIECSTKRQSTWNPHIMPFFFVRIPKPLA